MNTSDNKNPLYISTNDIITTAIRKCGMPDGMITPVMIKYAKQNLYWTLLEFNNKGSPIFAQDRVVMGLNLDQQTYDMPQYVSQVVWGNWRQTFQLQYEVKGGIDPQYLIDQNYTTFATTETYFTASLGSNLDLIGPSILGNQLVFKGNVNNWMQRPMAASSFTSIDIEYTNNLAIATANNASVETGPYTFNAPVTVQNIGTIGVFFFGDQTVTLRFEVSNDQNSWTTVYQDESAKSYKDGEWLWHDLNPQLNVAYVRVSCAAGQRLTLRGFYIANLETASELPMARINRDTYGMYVNKTLPGAPLSFFFDKQITPQISLWQQPLDVFNYQLIIKRQNSIDTPNLLSEELNIPRWYQEAVIWNLAARLILELPRNQVDVSLAGMLTAKAIESMETAFDQMNDRAPISIFGNFSCYTR
jgi:hypothetical protein